MMYHVSTKLTKKENFYSQYGLLSVSKTLCSSRLMNHDNREVVLSNFALMTTDMRVNVNSSYIHRYDL